MWSSVSDLTLWVFPSLFPLELRWTLWWPDTPIATADLQCAKCSQNVCGDRQNSAITMSPNQLSPDLFSDLHRLGEVEEHAFHQDTESARLYRAEHNGTFQTLVHCNPKASLVPWGFSCVLTDHITLISFWKHPLMPSFSVLAEPNIWISKKAYLQVRSFSLWTCRLSDSTVLYS